MATTVPEIRVFAMFPLDPANPERWNWVHCLTFPLDTLNELQVTSKPYKWIRYATGVVVGAQGDLSFHRDSHEVLEYNDDLPVGSTDLYYHTSNDEKRNTFPIDPDAGRTTITGSGSDVTSQRADFNSDVEERDTVCVLTSYRRCYCDAVHLLPHIKGDQYIENYTRHRSRDPAGNDIVCKIDDVRNGIFLNKIAHCGWGMTMAFLMTPNFAMSTADVDPTTPPTEKRCTAHFFDPNSPEALGNSTLRSGCVVRMPDTVDEWPPNILFDAVYADVVLRHFAPQTMRDTLKQWKSSFYPEEITSAAQASYHAIVDERTAKARDERAARRTDRESHGSDDLDFYDCLMILPYLMVPPDKREEVWRKAAEDRAERQRSHLEDKVVGWAREVADARP